MKGKAGRPKVFSGPRATLGIRLDQEIVDMIDTLALIQHRTRSMMVTVILEEWFKENKRKVEEQIEADR